MEKETHKTGCDESQEPMSPVNPFYLDGTDDNALIFEEGLCRMFARCPTTIKRAVERGELPPPTRLFGQRVWTVASIRRLIEDKLEREMQQTRELESRVTKLRP